MSMGGEAGQSARSAINVTPLIDVLLVLLIIFMVIQPNSLRGLDASVPQPSQHEAGENPRTVVVQVQPDDSGGTAYKINQQPVSLADMPAKLSGIFDTRSDKVMFVKGDKDLDFGSVMPVIDYGKAVGVDNIGIITPAVESAKFN